METADNTAMHLTETTTLCSSLDCPNTTNEEITKEREQEILYGNNEDGDAESEDSFRLIYSDEGEDQQTTNRGITADVMKSPGTLNELGSSLPSSEMTERPNILKEEMMTNGQVSHERDSRQVEETNKKAELSPSSDLAIKAEGLNGQADEFINGECDENVDTSLALTPAVDLPNKQWHYSGHFGDCSKQTRRDSFPRQTPPPNPCSEKYYNQNAHYGRDKNCLRALKLHSRTETRQSIHSGPRNSLSNYENSLSAIERTEDSKTASKSIDHRSTPDSLDTNVSCAQKSTDKVSENNEIQKNVANDVSGPSDDLTEAKNAEKTPNCTANDESTREEKSTENESSTDGKPARIVGRKSSQVDTEVESKNDQVAGVLESTNVDENSSNPKAIVSVENSSNPTEKKEDPIADPVDRKVGEFSPEMETESVKDGDDTPENTGEVKNSENLMSETREKLENDKSDRSGESENCQDLKDIDDQGEKKTTNKKPDQVVSENKIVCDNEGNVSSPKVDEPVDDKKEIKENSVAILSQESNDESDAGKGHESESSRENSEKKQGEDIEENVETVKIGDSLNKTKENDCSISPEKLDDSKALKPSRDSSIVAIGGSKTNEGKTNVSSDQKVTSEPEVSLTDSEKKIISSSNNDADRQAVNDNVTEKVATLRSSLKRTLSELLLDEMDLSKRIQIGRKKNENPSESSVKENDSAHIFSGIVTDEIEKTDKNIDTSNVENTVTNSNGDNIISESEGSSITDNVVEKSCGPRRNSEQQINVVRSDDHEADDDERADDCEVIEVPAKRKQKRSRKSLNTLRENSISQDESQDTENVRQRRKTAKNAEEIIRKGCLANTDSESNDSLSKFVTVSHRTSNNSRATSPPTLKRNYVDGEVKSEGTTKKKLKSDVTLNGDISMKSQPVESDTKQTLQHVRQFFRRDVNGSLAKLRQEELEELLIQKIVETITMRDEIGRLREQAKVSERNQEATRVKCQLLAKQIKDFDMVLGRYKSDLRTNPDARTVIPIKINRSVGLQVNFVTDHGIQNLRQLQQAQKLVTGGTVNGTIAAHPQQPIQQPKQQAQQLPQPPAESPTIVTGVKRTVKVRSPRRPDNPITTPVNSAASTPVNSPHASTVTPTALVVSKPVSDARPSLTSANQPTSASHPQLLTSNQTILVNGNLTNQAIRQSTPMQASKTKNSDLIDLTQEEEKTKAPAGKILTAANNETSPNVSGVQKIAPRFHTVIQTIPGNMAITAQTGIRVVQPSSQPTPTALVNNMNAPRLAYVTMQSGMGPRQVVLTSTATPIRPAPTNNIRTSFPIAGTINNNAVRVIPTTAAPPLIYKHPASLPESLNTMSSPSWKLPPPAPSLKISKVTNGIVLSWNMALSDKYADIASYQLYAYQEITGIAPSSSLWKKVGDVRALPLPMACTLTQFSEGNNYYFAVRAVDKHSRLGQYSQPGNISL